jgi:hypothetical protein
LVFILLFELFDCFLFEVRAFIVASHEDQHGEEQPVGATPTAPIGVGARFAPYLQVQVTCGHTTCPPD